MPSPSGYPSQQDSSSHPSHTSSHPPHTSSVSSHTSSHPSHTSSRRSTLPITPAYDHYDHASFSPHPSAPPPSLGSTSYNPSFPIAIVPVRQPSANPSGLPPPGESPIPSRQVTSMPMPVHSNTASSMPYDTRPQNIMPSSSQPGIRGGPQSSAQGYSYRASTAVEILTVRTYNRRLTADVHERHDDSSSFGNENLEHSREGTRPSGDYSRERAPPSHFSAGRQRERSDLLQQEAHF